MIVRCSIICMPSGVGSTNIQYPVEDPGSFSTGETSIKYQSMTAEFFVMTASVSCHIECNYRVKIHAGFRRKCLENSACKKNEIYRFLVLTIEYFSCKYRTVFNTYHGSFKHFYTTKWDSNSIRLDPYFFSENTWQDRVRKLIYSSFLCLQRISTKRWYGVWSLKTK